MLKKFVFTFIIVLFTSHVTSQSQSNLNEINHVWDKFCKAFDSLDYKLMAEIHSKNLIRISGGKRISDYTTYINNYKERFKEAKKNNVTNNISLRFFERINNDSIASERGIYKLTRVNNKKENKVYYGQFHVLLSKENNTWKISMDYDSNEGNSIGEKEYLKAKGMKELNSFIKK